MQALSHNSSLHGVLLLALLVGPSPAFCGSDLVIANFSGIRDREIAPTPEQPIGNHPLLRPCTVDQIDEQLLCGTVTVPENREDPTGRRIDLRVVLLPALDPEPGLAPLFDLAGGPGVAATNGAAFYADAGRAFRLRRDVVLVDQRGTGSSNALHCPELEGYDGDPRHYLREMYPVEAVEDCRKALELRADLAQYTTTAAAADLDAVRSGLGYGRIDLFGLSYGTRLALEYMRRYPARVRSAALWGAVPTSLSMLLFHAPDTERARNILLAACEADGRCHQAFPDLRREWNGLRTTAASRPARARYRAMSGVEAEVDIPRAVFASEIRRLMYTPAGARQVPHIIHEAAAGNFLPFLERVIPDRPYQTGMIAEGLYLSVTCTEDVSRIDPGHARQLASGTFPGDYRVVQQRRACSRWPRGAVGADFHDPVSVTVPTLIISGHADPATPPRWGDEVARHLPNSHHVVVRHLAHLADGLSNAHCLDHLLNQFYSRGTAEGLDEGCLATMKPPPFVTNLNE